jgi:hypothetical protein
MYKKTTFEINYCMHGNLVLHLLSYELIQFRTSETELQRSEQF